MPKELKERTVALLIAPRGTEEPEFIRPKEALEDAGATVEVISAEVGQVNTVNNDLDIGDTFSVDRAFSDVAADDYDAVVVPGGCVGADTLRGDDEAVQFVRGFFEEGTPAAVICHGPWVLVEADVVEGRTLTSYPTLQTDIRNAGGEWVDQEVVVDDEGGGSPLVTSRNPDDLPAFCTQVVEVFAKDRAEAGRAAQRAA